VLSVLLRYTDFEYPFGIFKLFLHHFILQEGAFHADQNGYLFAETSAKTKENVDEVFSKLGKLVLFFFSLNSLLLIISNNK